MVGVLPGKYEMSIYKSCAFASVCLIIAFSSAKASELNIGLLRADQIRSTLLGATILGEYSNGLEWQERMNQDLTTNYSEGKQTINGRISFRNYLMCFTYGEASELTSGCFEVWQRSSNCFDFYGTISPTNDKTAATLAQKHLAQGWTARGWKSNQPSTCVSELIS